MSKVFHSDRRRFLGTTARVLATAPFALAGSAGIRTHAPARLPFQMVLSSLDRTPEWLNSPPLKAADL